MTDRNRKRVNQKVLLRIVLNKHRGKEAKHFFQQGLIAVHPAVELAFAPHCRAMMTQHVQARLFNITAEIPAGKQQSGQNQRIVDPPLRIFPMTNRLEYVIQQNVYCDREVIHTDLRV